MPAIRLLEIDTATGRVTGEWRGDDARAPEAVAGRSFVPIADDLVVPDGATWNGSTVVAQASTNHVMGLRDFFRLFTRTELADIAALRATNDPEVTYFWTFAMLEPWMDLRSPDVLAGLAILRAKDSPSSPGDKVLTNARATAIAAGTRPGDA